MIDDGLDLHLSQVESLLGDMATLLVRGDALAYEDATAAMRKAMLELGHAMAIRPMDTPQDHDARARFDAIAQALARQREHLARRFAVAERALATMLPTPDVTYSAPGRPAVFRGATARFYTAPGL